MAAANTCLSPRAGRKLEAESGTNRLHDRLGLNVPYEWWPRAATLKAFEAAGLRWVQVASPPSEMLADPTHVVRHGQALRQALDVTELRVVVHGPTSLRLGSPLHNRAGEGLIEYAHQLGSSHVVYHPLDVRRRGPDTEAEQHSLQRLGRWAEALGVVLCLENLCPVYPAPPNVGHDPEAVRKLVLDCDSPSIRMLFDLGHANVVADSEGTGVGELLQQVKDVVGLFHVHDNLGARRRGGGGFAFDPLRLDLHLPPGAGTLAWDKVAPMLVAHEAPLMMEIHPSHRPSAATLRDSLSSVLVGEPVAPPVADLELGAGSLA